MFDYKGKSENQRLAYNEMQRQAFYDLADECEKCGRLYVDVCGCEPKEKQQ